MATENTVPPVSSTSTPLSGKSFVLTEQFFDDLRAGIVSAKLELDNVSLTPDEAEALVTMAEDSMREREAWQLRYASEAAAWAYFESPRACSHQVGTAPFRQLVGMAYTRSGEPGAVIWTEQGELDKWAEPAFIPTRHIAKVVDEAISASRVDFHWFKERFGEGNRKP